MAIPVSTPSFSHMQTEYGGSNPISISEYYRSASQTGTVPSVTAAGTYGTIPQSGTFSFGTMRGKGKFIFNPVISANAVDYNIRNAAVAAGWDGSETLICTLTINSGIYVYASSTGTYALRTGTGFPNGHYIIINNSGAVVGRGGAGGAGGYASNGGAGGTGGPAFYAEVAVSVNNAGTFAGGGGGGGGAGGYFDGKTHYTGGGGGGARALGAGGSGAANGGAGSLTAAGGGGNPGYGAVGGAGGGLGAAGAAGASPYYGGGGGGAAGTYVTAGGNVTWVATGTLLGAAG